MAMISEWGRSLENQSEEFSFALAWERVCGLDVEREIGCLEPCVH